MEHTPNALTALRLLFELAQQDYPAHVSALAGHLRLTRIQVGDILLELERAGLVRAERARLTMAGLVLATRLPPLSVRPPTPAADQPVVRPPAHVLREGAPVAPRNWTRPCDPPPYQDKADLAITRPGQPGSVVPSRRQTPAPALASASNKGRARASKGFAAR